MSAIFVSAIVTWSGAVHRVIAQDAAPTLRLSENVPALHVAEGLELDLLLQEPAVANPLYLNFDQRGRLWVVQFRQYPWPAGLKLLSRDNVWRNVYQPAFPPPPPHAEDSPFRGRDQITIHEDTNGDGVFDHHQVFLTGLNLATAALPGRGGVFVMNPPYLLFYADHDQNDVPDSQEPKILLSGFGIEDTHSIGNSLRWGPDGWIYGTQGSTVSGAIVRHGADGLPMPDEAPIHSMGQNVWRYHPEDHKYEVFAEGGGNAFGVEFDSVGRVYSGHNGGDTRGFHYVQGGYYSKNFGKHGLHSNPFTFSYYGAMRHHAVERFTHTFKIYDADSLPPLYHGKLISISPVLHNVMLNDIFADGSTRMTKDIAPIVTVGANERDNWFTPVDIQIGPDGALYLADWYSMQSNHYRNHEGQTNPDLGRVYRLRSAAQKAYPVFDLSTYSSRELVEQGLRHPNRWYRETALRLLGDRKDQAVVPLLKTMASAPQDPHALEALWALHQCDGLDDAIAEQLLGHPQPAVRGWTIRLLCDRGEMSESLAQRLAQLAELESDAEVRLQLACSCRRLPTRLGLKLLGKLLMRAQDAQDAQDPLMPNAIWWGVEAHAGNHAAILSWLQQSEPWRSPLADASQLTSNLMRRWAILGTQEDLLMCAELLRLSPNAAQSGRLLEGFTRAFEGRAIPQLPTELVDQLARVEGRFGTLLGIRRGETAALDVALSQISDVAVSEDERGQLIRALGEVQAEQAVPVFLQLLQGEATAGITAASLTALQDFDRQEIGATIVEQFARMSPPLQETAQSVLASRQSWSQLLIAAIDAGRVDAKQINQDTVARLAWHRDPELQRSVSRLFPKSAADPGVLDQRIELVEKIVLAGNGNPLQGQREFHEAGTCGKCHQMFGRGGAIGPDLTSYNRSNLRTMLLGIIHPDAEIREGFENLTILTDDGQVITGFKVDEDANTLILRAADGQSRAIDKSGIEELHQNKTSLMPTGLLDGLSDTQLRDLFAFLTSTTPPN